MSVSVSTNALIRRSVKLTSPAMEPARRPNIPPWRQSLDPLRLGPLKGLYGPFLGQAHGQFYDHDQDIPIFTKEVHLSIMPVNDDFGKGEIQDRGIRPIFDMRKKKLLKIVFWQPGHFVSEGNLKVIPWLSTVMAAKRDHSSFTAIWLTVFIVYLCQVNRHQ